MRQKNRKNVLWSSDEQEKLESSSALSEKKEDWNNPHSEGTRIKDIHLSGRTDATDYHCTMLCAVSEKRNKEMRFKENVVLVEINAKKDERNGSSFAPNNRLIGH